MDELVSLFDPDAQTLKIVEEVKKIDPVPMEQLSRDPGDQVWKPKAEWNIERCVPIVEYRPWRKKHI